MKRFDRLLFAGFVFLVSVLVLGQLASFAAKPGGKGKGKGKARQASNDDPDSSDYSSEKRHVSAAERDAMIAEAEKKLTELKAAGTGKKDDEKDFFLLGTIDLQKHVATVDYPIKQGLKKAAEFVADFMLDKPPRAIRQWRAINRAKTEKAADALRQRAKAQSIEGQLEAFKLNKPGKKSLDDFFLVGTADLNLSTENADVRFQIIKGTKATSDFLLDFILSGTAGSKRQWHVFFRATTQAEADKYIAQLRNWYDTMESQRKQIAAIYHARTTRRC